MKKEQEQDKAAMYVYMQLSLLNLTISKGQTIMSRCIPLAEKYRGFKKYTKHFRQTLLNIDTDLRSKLNQQQEGAFDFLDESCTLHEGSIKASEKSLSVAIKKVYKGQELELFTQLYTLHSIISTCRLVSMQITKNIRTATKNKQYEVRVTFPISTLFERINKAFKMCVTCVPTYMKENNELLDIPSVYKHTQQIAKEVYNIEKLTAILNKSNAAVYEQALTEDERHNAMKLSKRREEIKALYSEKKSKLEIAKILGIPKSTLYAYLKKYPLPRVV